VNVAIADIPTRGLRVDLASPPPWARAAVDAGLGASGPARLAALTGELQLTRHGPHLALRGELHAVAEIGCARCGTPLVASLGGEVSTVYSPVSTLPTHSDGASPAHAEGTGSDEASAHDESRLPRPPVNLPFDVLEVGEYAGESFDLAEALREWAAVESPDRMLCGEIDPAEEEACLARFREHAGETRRAPEVDPRFAVLASFKPSTHNPSR
jgi:uncharacterized metal-binding protein YceD (DUF177 family)